MIKIFNTKNHKLDSNRLNFLNAFNSDNFCGVAIPPQNQISYTNDVFNFSNNSITINSSVLSNDELILINNGVMLGLSQEDINITPTSKHFYFIKYPLNCNFTNNNIYNDNFEEATIEYLKYTTYTTISYDINGNVVYSNDENCVGIMSSVTLDTGDIINYTGKTIISSLGKTQTLYNIIPLFLFDGSRLVSLIEARNKFSVEQWLSAKSLGNLWENLHHTFTHQSGSVDGNGYGKIANFDFSGDSVLHKNTKILDVNLYNKFSLPTYKSKNTNAFYLNPDGSLEANVLPMDAGGTGARGKKGSRRNLGLYWEYTTPEEFCVDYDIVPDVGDIYFKVLD